MPLGSVTYESKAFKACYGDTHSSEWPASFTLHLYNGHPLRGGVELAATGGYAPVTVANTSANFPVVDGEVDSPLFAFPTATAAWSATGRYAVLKDGSTLVEFWRLARKHQINITEAGQVARVPITLWHNDIETN